MKRIFIIFIFIICFALNVQAGVLPGPDWIEGPYYNIGNHDVRLIYFVYKGRASSTWNQCFLDNYKKHMLCHEITGHEYYPESVSKA